MPLVAGRLAIGLGVGIICQNSAANNPYPPSQYLLANIAFFSTPANILANIPVPWSRLESFSRNQEDISSGLPVPVCACTHPWKTGQLVGGRDYSPKQRSKDFLPPVPIFASEYPFFGTFGEYSGEYYPSAAGLFALMASRA